MARAGCQSVEEYLARQPVSARPTLDRVRRTILKALPKAEECISYQIPSYRVHGGTAVYFAGFKNHYSVYPATRTLSSAFGDEIEPYRKNSTLRFSFTEPVPASLIARVAKFRAKELAGRQKKR